MGTYVYTRRKDVKKVDGIEIVRFGYAYKPSTRFFNNPRHEATCDRLVAAGERAAEATSHVKYGVRGDKWKYAGDKYGMPIFKLAENEAAHFDDVKREYVGILRKKGNKFYVEWQKTEA